MEKMTFDMQASLNPQGGIALFPKAQDKSSIGSRHGQSNSFNSVLDEKTAEAISDDGSMEKINEDSDPDELNSDFAAIPGLNPIPLRMAHPLLKDVTLSETEAIKPLPLMDKMKLAVLSLPTAKNREDLTEGTQQTAIQIPTGMNDEANQALLEDSAAGIAKSTFTAISEIIQSQPVMIPQSDQDASMTGALGNNSLPPLGLSGIRARNNAKSDMPLTTEKRSHADLAQTNDAVSEAVSLTLGATVADTPFPEVDSSQVIM